MGMLPFPLPFVPRVLSGVLGWSSTFQGPFSLGWRDGGVWEHRGRQGSTLQEARFGE